MKPKTYITGIVFLLSIQVMAGFVPLQNAEKVARNFYFEKFNQFERPVKLEEIQLSLLYTGESEGKIYYYVFALNPGGFVIVSADDRLAPVIGYSFTNDFSGEYQPPHVKCWLKQYEDQIDYVRNPASGSDLETNEQWTYYLEDDFSLPVYSRKSLGVDSLITTLWNQDFPYNYYCPADPAGPGGHAYAGCGATAMGQIFYYWRWPTHGQGQHCYTPQTHPEYGEQCADFENTWYRWDEMVDYPAVQPINTAIAELLYHNGVSVDMDYQNVGGSPPLGGYYAPPHLEYFRYDQSYQTIYIDSME